MKVRQKLLLLWSSVAGKSHYWLKTNRQYFFTSGTPTMWWEKNLEMEPQCMIRLNVIPGLLHSCSLPPTSIHYTLSCFGSSNFSLCAWFCVLMTRPYPAQSGNYKRLNRALIHKQNRPCKGCANLLTGGGESKEELLWSKVEKCKCKKEAANSFKTTAQNTWTELLQPFRGCKYKSKPSASMSQSLCLCHFRL